jgi:hypothetical protein
MLHTAVLYRTKDEIRAMALPELECYISLLRQRAAHAHPPALHSVEKHLAVAERLRKSVLE